LDGAIVNEPIETSNSKTRHAEFAALFRVAQSRLYGYIHALVRDLNDADDLFQQTTLILWRRFDDFDPQRCFLSWACGIARLAVTNFLRSRGRQRLYFSDDLNLLLIEAQEEMTCEEEEDRRDALAKCIAKLRERDQQLVMECYQDQADVNQAAGRRGRSPQSVYNSLRRIRRALYECIARTLTHESRPEWIP
jgi:RNA polymerase sigma-70 factor (ECF subfamily)